MYRENIRRAPCVCIYVRRERQREMFDEFPLRNSLVQLGSEQVGRACRMKLHGPERPMRPEDHHGSHYFVDDIVGIDAAATLVTTIGVAFIADVAAPTHVQLVSCCNGHDVTTRVKGNGRDRSREQECLETFTGECVPESNFAVERAGDENIRAHRIESHDPRRAHVPMQRPDAFSRREVRQLHRVVATGHS